jgi:hypothetical protein
MKKPAISMIVAGGILALTGLFMIFMMLNAPQPSVFSDSDANQKLMLLKAGAMLYGVILMALSAISIWGGIAMLQQGNKTLCMAGAICTVVGGVIGGLFPGWLLILPIGIWSIVVLRRARSVRDPLVVQESNAEQGVPPNA